MKILGVVGSLREGGNTETAIREALRAAEEKGASVDIILLHQFKVNPCRACGKCKTGECPQDDDAKKLLPLFRDADGIIIGSPVYYGGISGALKCLLDRCRPLKQQGNKLRNKIGGSIAVGKVWGHTNVLETIEHFFCAQGMLPVSIFANPGMGAQLFATKIGDAKSDQDGIKASRMVGERVIDVLKAMKREDLAT